MVDLTLEGSRLYWKDFMDSSVFRVIMLLESVEVSLCRSSPEIEKAMAELGEVFDELDVKDFKEPQVFLDVLAYLCTGRYLRVLQTVDTIKPGAASKIIAFAEQSSADNVSARLFLKRNVIFERYRLLARVVSEERLKLLSEALEDV
jgi:intracellular multiplication protein IcmW|tara:strand:+ start:223 stop:663 length:441 start_codon:yes stop_codon:yes gene_type:complete